MFSMRAFLVLTWILDFRVLGHGTLTWPKSTRQNGTLAHAGSCVENDCMWYSDFVQIPGEATLDAEAFRTFNVKVSSGSKDYTRKNPWRAPGTAPVFGSGCGILGGGPTPNVHSVGTLEFSSYAAGTDGVELPEHQPTVWRKGTIQEVAWAITANHGGGYSYRLCPKDANISEACFQRTVLRFAGNKQWLQYGNMMQAGIPINTSRYELPLVKVTEGTHPVGSEWVRNPIPSCMIFDANECAGLPKDDFVECNQAAAGNLVVQCLPNMTQFPEPLPGLSGHVPVWFSDLDQSVSQWSTTVALLATPGGNLSMGFPFSIVDLVIVPEDIKDGDYLLSWRWDCEQSQQVWQNCADIKIVGPRELDSTSADYHAPIFP